MKSAIILILAATVVAINGQQQQQLCPQPFGDYPDGNGCITFLRCWRGLPYRMRCPGGMAFDPDTRRCGNQQQIACVQNNQVAGPAIGGNGAASPAAIGQLQQPTINQVQLAGFQPGTFPNGGLFGVPLGGQPNANAGAGGGLAAGLGAGANAGGGRGANAGLTGGVTFNRAAAAGANAGGGLANPAGSGNQPLPAGNPAPQLRPGFNPAFPPQQGFNPVVQPVGNPAFMPDRSPAEIPVNPVRGQNAGPISFQPGAPRPQRVGGNRGGFLNYPLGQGVGQPARGQGQGQGSIHGGAGVPGGNIGVVGGGQNGQPGNMNAGGDEDGAGQGQGQGQGQAVGAGVVPIIVANQRQSATINQDQSVGVAPGK